MAFIQNIQGARITGSITASFTGDGSGLTGIVSASNADTASYVDLVAGPSITINQVGTSFEISGSAGSSDPFPYTGSAIISGSLTVTGSVISTQGFTGSLSGNATTATSASYATTASYAVSASYEINYETSSSYAETASFVPAGVGGLYGGDGTISLNTTAAVAGNLLLSGSNGTQSGSTLSLYGSGSANPVFKVDGSAGELFSISDSLSGSLFAINNISGLPIFEIFSDDQILYGDSTAPALTTTVKNTVSATGAFTVYSLPTASYDGAWFEYVVKSGSNARTGQIMAVWNGSNSAITETTTTDIGSTSNLAFYGLVSGSNFVLTGSAASADWTVKTIIRSI